MARPTWRGAISFGLVNVPVQLYTAVHSQEVRFRELHRETRRPVGRRRVDTETGEEVSREDVVKGYKLGGDRYVLVEPDELDVLDPSASRLIEIHDYVQQAEIDPVHYDRAYYLIPDGETATKPFTLLTEAMGRAGKVAIARFVMRGKEHLAAIRARDGILVLSTMYYADEVLDPAELGDDWGETNLRDREIEMAEQLIESMTTEFRPDSYENEHRQRVLSYIEAKASDTHFEVPTAEPDSGQVIDLMAALERSLARTQGADGEQPDTGDTPAPAGTDYDAMSREQLYELAKERDVPGRSRMSKPELVEVLTNMDAEATSGAA